MARATGMCTMIRRPGRIKGTFLNRSRALATIVPERPHVMKKGA